MFFLMLACTSIKKPPQQLLSKQEPVVQEEGKQLPPENQQQWPPSKWSHARAYTYNFTPYGPGKKLRIWDAKGWSENIKQTIDIDQKQAQTAISLLHRTQGEVQASKCPFPRHAVVFFNGEDPIASINICFSCTDILIHPPYFNDDEQSYGRYEMMGAGEEPLLFEIHETVLEDWGSYFDKIGAQRYEQKP